mmetsp:Transcript_21416/g.49077  ORF Transcript_21416/g.49077 Transcript_21416/m.49077 type:complete len:172 (-) Transcript_21416:126-641(-)
MLIRDPVVWAVLQLAVMLSSASLLRAPHELADTVDAAMSEDETVPDPTRQHGHVYCLENCDEEALAATNESASKAAAAAQPKCICEQNENMECECSSHCGEAETRQICLELIGECKCLYSDATCLCDGHCPNANDRKEACLAEPGCEWSGDAAGTSHWCQAQIGMLWSSPS